MQLKDHLAGVPVDDCIYQHLDWVAVCEQVNNVKGMPDNADLHKHMVISQT